MLSTVFPDIIDACTDDNGCIRWSTACQAAKDHGLLNDFHIDYGTRAWAGGVDASEFLEWLGY